MRMKSICNYEERFISASLLLRTSLCTKHLSCGCMFANNWGSTWEPSWLPCYIRAACLIGLWTPKGSSLYLSLFPQHLDQHGHVSGILPSLWFQSWRIPFQEKHHWVSIKLYYLCQLFPPWCPAPRALTEGLAPLRAEARIFLTSSLSFQTCLWALGQAVLGTHKLFQEWFWLPTPARLWTTKPETPMFTKYLAILDHI